MCLSDNSRQVCKSAGKSSVSWPNGLHFLTFSRTTLQIRIPRVGRWDAIHAAENTNISTRTKNQRRPNADVGRKTTIVVDDVALQAQTYRDKLRVSRARICLPMPRLLPSATRERFLILHLGALMAKSSSVVGRLRNPYIETALDGRWNSWWNSLTPCTHTVQYKGSNSISLR